MRKPLRDITDHEWIEWEWIDLTRIGDGERMFSRGHERTPEEAAQAAHDIESIREALANPPKPLGVAAPR